MAGGIGATIEIPEGGSAPGKAPIHAWLFGEDQARYIVTTRDTALVLAVAREGGVPAGNIGVTGGNALILPDGDTISVDELTEAHQGWLPKYMGEDR